MNQYQSKCYCTNLRRSAGMITNFYDARLKQYGISAAQYCLLDNLQRLGSANITHWAQAVGLDRSTMIRNIRPLEKSSLIERVDGNGKTYALSEKGKAVLKAASAAWEKAQREIESLLGEADAGAILRISNRLQELRGKEAVRL